MIPNVELRDYVQRSAFDLQLARTHIAALVYLDLAIRNVNARISTPRTVGANVWSHFAGGAAGLIRRGLVRHHYREPVRDSRGHVTKTWPLKHHYTITKAGRLMIGLLKEAGLYDEYAGQLIVVVNEKSA